MGGWLISGILRGGRKEDRVWDSGLLQEHEIMDYSFKV
jgi:hypothetical protein